MEHPSWTSLGPLSQAEEKCEKSGKRPVRGTWTPSDRCGLRAMEEVERSGWGRDSTDPGSSKVA